MIRNLYLGISALAFCVVPSCELYAEQAHRIGDARTVIRSEREYQTYLRSRIEMWQELEALKCIIPTEARGSAWSTKNPTSWMLNPNYHVVMFYELARKKNNEMSETSFEFIQSYFELRKFTNRSPLQCEVKGVLAANSPIAVIENLSGSRIMGITLKGKFVSYEQFASSIKGLEAYTPE